MDELPLFSAGSQRGLLPEEWRTRVLTVRRTNPMDPPLQMHFGTRALLSDGHIYVEMVTHDKRKDVRLDSLLMANNIVMSITLPDNEFGNKDLWTAAAARAMDSANTASVLSQIFLAQEQKTVVSSV